MSTPGERSAVGPVAWARPPVAPVVAVEGLDDGVAGQAHARRAASTSSNGSRWSMASSQSETSACSGVSPSGVGTGAGMSLSGSQTSMVSRSGSRASSSARHPPEHDVGHLGPGASAPEPDQVHQLLHVTSSLHHVSPSASRMVASNSASLSVRRSSQHHGGVLARLRPATAWPGPRGRRRRRSPPARAPAGLRARSAWPQSRSIGRGGRRRPPGPGWSSPCFMPGAM